MDKRGKRAGSDSFVDDARPRVSGKFIFVGGEKLQIRGVTYGAFEPDAEGNEYHDLGRVETDFEQMAASGMNAVRIPHTTPPRALLDIAGRHRLRVMVGLSLEQQFGYFVDHKKQDLRRIEHTLRSRVRQCAGHPALLCYALGNEIPASTARWVGHRRVEQILERMYSIVKEEDPRGLVTYVNYPTTEYLQLQFLDLLCFNVYLESRHRLSAYLSRLQNIAGERPLLMSELGLDALRNGEAAQASVLDWQIRTSFERGCAGVFVFSWTDEWYRAGAQVDDWAFGLTTVTRQPKPALAAVRKAFIESPWTEAKYSPAISVVVCSHNGSRRIRECCAHLAELDYPDFEVIVVDDGSEDETGSIAEEFGFCVIHTEHRGLGNARNVGLEAARGDIVAYIDDDAYPDVDWLRFIVASFEDTGVVAAGGPNVSPPNDDWFAQCINLAPGNPAHVLITDTEAEQLPGCNLAIRRSALEAIGGFDARFRAAGDDVDICRRLADRDGVLAFCPPAMVWHHRRSTLRAYLKQQAGYGEGESLLDRKWRLSGHSPRRSGRVYSTGSGAGWQLFGSRIYHGVWGHAPFQAVYRGGSAADAFIMHAAYTATAALLLLSILSILWRPLWPAIPLLVIGFGTIFGNAFLNARRPAGRAALAAGAARWKWIGATTILYVLQPIARLAGKVRGHSRFLRPANRLRGWRLPRSRVGWAWSDTWLQPEKRIAALEAELGSVGAPLTRGGSYDSWDLEIHGGLLGGARVSVAVEDHSGAAQMIRYRLTPCTHTAPLAVSALAAVLAVLAAADAAWLASFVFAGAAAGIAAAMISASGRAMAWGLKAKWVLDR